MKQRKVYTKQKAACMIWILLDLMLPERTVKYSKNCVKVGTTPVLIMTTAKESIDDKGHVVSNSVLISD